MRLRAEEAPMLGAGAKRPRGERAASAAAVSLVGYFCKLTGM